ncbi:MAG: hypothetical protein Q7R45_07600 [Sulfuricaulis sp.]|nr:hypothetical protein [Sulfuricaulis sp.]
MNEEPHTYNLVVHKPDSVDVCRGCVMARYSGEFETFTELTAADVTARAAEFLARPLAAGETGYTLLLCGARAGQPFMVDLSEGYYEDAEVDCIRSALAAEVARITQASAVREQAKAGTRAREARGRMELARLKERYEGPMTG